MLSRSLLLTVTVAVQSLPLSLFQRLSQSLSLILSYHYNSYYRYDYCNLYHYHYHYSSSDRTTHNIIKKVAPATTKLLIIFRLTHTFHIFKTVIIQLGWGNFSTPPFEDGRQRSASEDVSRLSFTGCSDVVGKQRRKE